MYGETVCLTVSSSDPPCSRMSRCSSHRPTAPGVMLVAMSAGIGAWVGEITAIATRSQQKGSFDDQR